MTKVSVIIPTYNRSEQLKDAVQSVLDQCLDALEIIIIDDCSDPKYQNELESISSLSAQISLRRNKSNSGVSACRNVGLEAAAGDYVLFLDDDDVLLSNMLKQSLEIIEKEGTDLVSCRSEVIGDHVSEKKIRAYNWQKNGSFEIYDMKDRPMEHILLYHPPVHSFLIRKKAIGEARFSSELSYGEDLFFWLALAQKGLKLRRLDFVGCRYHLHQLNASARVTYAAKKKFYSEILKTFSLSKEIKGLCWFKMGMLAMKKGDLRSIIWLAKCLLNPILFLRHTRHYARLFL